VSPELKVASLDPGQDGQAAAIVPSLGWRHELAAKRQAFVVASRGDPRSSQLDIKGTEL